MPPLLLAIALILVSFILLIRCANYLVDGSADLARYFRISPIMVGLTIVAFGTSLPEFIVSLFSALNGQSDLALGNIIGSNIANIALIIGLCAIFVPLVVHSKTLLHEFPFMIFSAFLLLILANDHYLFRSGTFSLGRLDGLILLTIFAGFLIYIFRSISSERSLVQDEFKEEFQHKNTLWKNTALILIGITGVIIGGKLFVSGAGRLALILGWSEAFIGLLIASLGTSLPELVTSAVAAWRKHSDIAVGNIVGSNIFNILLVLGLTSLISPINVNPSMLAIDGMVMIAVTAIFLLFATTSSRITRLEGFTLFGSYLIYVIYLFTNVI